LIVYQQFVTGATTAATPQDANQVLVAKSRISLLTGGATPKLKPPAVKPVSVPKLASPTVLKSSMRPNAPQASKQPVAPVSRPT
jgi:hypothetical protein